VTDSGKTSAEAREFLESGEPAEHFEHSDLPCEDGHEWVAAGGYAFREGFALWPPPAPEQYQTLILGRRAPFGEEGRPGEV
jgi:hypothetical protein